MEYEIQLEIFKGPMDLLLHLIEKNEIDIYDIPISLITEQYLAYVQTIQLLNLEVVGDFLVMAATLMQIKVKMLLPQLGNGLEENGEGDDDPRLELAYKLIEYKKIKEASLSLQSLEMSQGRYYTRVAGEFADQIMGPEGSPVKTLAVWELMEAFKDILESLEPKPIQAIPKQEISIKQRMTEIIDLVTQEERVYFKKVFHDVHTKVGLITCFLALLELIRLHRVVAYQTVIFGDILISLPEKVGNTV